METKAPSEKDKKNNTDTLIAKLGNLKPPPGEFISKNSYYFKKYPLNDNSLLFLAIVTFHHKKGSIIEFTYPSYEEIIQKGNLEILSDSKPPNLILDEIFNQLASYCLPDGCHAINEDNQFFFIQSFDYLLYGISCYRQVKKEIEDDQENTRHCIQKAICIVSPYPFFGQFYSKLSVTVDAFFNQTTLKDKKIISQLFESCAGTNYKNLNLNEIYSTFSVKKLIAFTKEKIFLLLKMIMLEKKILVFGKVSGDVCGFVLTLLSILPGNLLFNFNCGGNIQNYLKCLEMFGLPLKIGNEKYKIYPLISLLDIDNLTRKEDVNFLIGTTNQLVLKSPRIKFDCVVNIDTMKITVTNDDSKMYKTTKYEKKLYTSLHNKLKEINFKYENDNWLTNLNNNSSFYYGSDDHIRNIFKKNFYDFYIAMAFCIKMTKNTNEELHKSLDLIKLNDVVDSDGEVESKLKNKILKENERLTKKTIKKLLDNYNMDFILNWLQTTNFIIWSGQFSPQLSLRSPIIKRATNVLIYYENGDYYNGTLEKGKKSGTGIYNYVNKGYVYNGEWENDMRNGNGSYTSEDNKCIFDGEWKNDMKHGNGKLIEDKVKYSGTFFNDVYSGTGVLCDEMGNIYEGDFENGKFNGMGHLKKENGDTYIGAFVDGLFEGKGQLTTEDGTIYDGYFSKGKKNGNGFLMKPNGEKEEGYFENDQFVSETKK